MARLAKAVGQALAERHAFVRYGFIFFYHCFSTIITRVVNEGAQDCSNFVKPMRPVLIPMRIQKAHTEVVIVYQGVEVALL